MPHPPHSSHPFRPAFNREATWRLQARYVAHESAFRDVSDASRSGDTELKNTYTRRTHKRESPRRAEAYWRSLRLYGVKGDTGAWQEGRPSQIQPTPHVEMAEHHAVSDGKHKASANSGGSVHGNSRPGAAGGGGGKGGLSGGLTQPAGWQSLLSFSILFLACLAGFSSRLFAVIRFESIIHEFDPW